MAEIKSELSMKIEELTKKMSGSLDENASLTNLQNINSVNPNNIVTSVKNNHIENIKTKKAGNIVINVSTYDTLTKLKNMDGKDYATMLVYLLELHLMGDLSRIASLNIDNETKKNIVENLNSFNQTMNSILEGSE